MFSITSKRIINETVKNKNFLLYLRKIRFPRKKFSCYKEFTKFCKLLSRKLHEVNKRINDTPTFHDYLTRGQFYYDLKLFDQSIRDCNTALKIIPKFSISSLKFAFYRRGNCLDELKMYNEAIKDFDEAINYDENFAEAYTNRGITKLKLGMNKEAIKDFNKAIELSPTNRGISYYNRGISKTKMSLNKEAIDDFSKAIELLPNYVQAYNNRGFIKIKLNSFNEAIEDFNKALRIEKDPVFLANLGFAKYKLSMVEEAMKDYKEAIKMDSTYHYTYYYLGIKKKDEKKYKEAIFYFEKSILLMPNFIDSVKEIDICSKLLMLCKK